MDFSRPNRIPASGLHYLCRRPLRGLRQQHCGDQQATAAHPGTKVDVAPFAEAEPGRTEFDCRLVGPVKTPDGQTFEAYIRKALVDELQLSDADAYA